MQASNRSQVRHMLRSLSLFWPKDVPVVSRSGSWLAETP
jgi:hypothetical protein